MPLLFKLPKRSLGHNCVPKFNLGTRGKRVSANVVYIQFNGEENRRLAEELRSSLKKQGFVAPGVEKVDRDYESNIRFFYTNDHEKAREVASLVDKFLKEKRIHKQLKLQDMSGRDFKSPQGQIEVWLNLNKP